MELSRYGHLHLSFRGSPRRCTLCIRWPPGCRRAPAAPSPRPAAWRTGPRATSPRSWGTRTSPTASGSRGSCCYLCEGDERQSVSAVHHTHTHTHIFNATLLTDNPYCSPSSQSFWTSVCFLCKPAISLAGLPLKHLYRFLPRPIQLQPFMVPSNCLSPCLSNTFFFPVIFVIYSHFLHSPETPLSHSIPTYALTLLTFCLFLLYCDGKSIPFTLLLLFSAAHVLSDISTYKRCQVKYFAWLSGPSHLSINKARWSNGTAWAVPFLTPSPYGVHTHTPCSLI